MFTLTVKPHVLTFKFEAKTSRNSFHSKKTYLFELFHDEDQSKKGFGECAPLLQLSIDDFLLSDEKYFKKLESEIRSLETLSLEIIARIIPKNLPSVRFALETAYLDWKNGGEATIFTTPSTLSTIPINGLIWMGTEDFLRKQIDEKIKEGFTILKLKIGGLDFDKELKILDYCRTAYGNFITIRLDANGGFTPKEALRKIDQLSKFCIHSIEQPIQVQQIKELEYLCKHSPIPIALDEELIGVYSKTEKEKLLSTLKPHYIVIKPTLLGGFVESKEWIEIAEKNKIGWWMTSTLESNIGLNAIAQFTNQFIHVLPQGLGTGKLFEENFLERWKMESGQLIYNNLPK